MAENKTNKIFNNSFEDSEYDGRSLNWKADPSWTENKDSETTIIDNILMDEIHRLISTSKKFKKFNKKAKNGKIPKLNKVQIGVVYSYIVENIKDYNIIEIFAATSEYFDIQGAKFYNSLSNAHKDDLLRELDERTNVIDKKKIRTLF